MKPIEPIDPTGTPSPESPAGRDCLYHGDHGCRLENDAEAPGHQRRFKGALAGLMRSYEEHGAINHVDGPDLPSRIDIERIVDDLEFIVFPGFYGRHRVTRANIEHLVGHKCDEVREALTAEVWKSLRWDCELDECCMRADECRARAADVVLDLLEGIPELRRVLMLDAEAALRGDPAASSLSEIIVCYPGFHAITIHRIANFLWKRQVPLIPRMMAEYVHSKTGIDIHPGATIGEGLFIDHGNAVVIGETTDIGENVKIYQGVTLGALSVRKKELKPGERYKRHPTVLSGATLYSGATILGGETVIAENAVIGGNVWLTRSVPPNTRVMIQPPYLLFHDTKRRVTEKFPMDYEI
jgi:serine O-acetyltransferase